MDNDYSRYPVELDQCSSQNDCDKCRKENVIKFNTCLFNWDNVEVPRYGNDEMIEKAKQLYQEGNRIVTIAKMLKRTEKTISKWIRYADI